MEIGSFIELQFDKGKEWHIENKYHGMSIARLNSGRAAIFHSVRCFNCDTVYLPFYQCDTVRNFLIKKGIKVKYYKIDEEFTPLLLESQSENEAIVIVNYYGIMSYSRMASLAKAHKNVIIDNSQAFFCEPINGCMNVYSARKFVGVPDGAYVIGERANKYLETYQQCYSSDTSLFLLQRIEYGCEGKTYKNRMLNEERLDKEDVMQMSRLTKTILDGIEYSKIKEIRRTNFDTAHNLFRDLNKLNPTKEFDENTIPMVYPLVIEDDDLLDRLLKAKHFQGHWWSYLLNEMPHDSFEYWLSRYMIPITIDQRYGEIELNYIKEVVVK